MNVPKNISFQKLKAKNREACLVDDADFDFKTRILFDKQIYEKTIFTLLLGLFLYMPMILYKLTYQTQIPKPLYFQFSTYTARPFEKVMQIKKKNKVASNGHLLIKLSIFKYYHVKLCQNH